MVAFWVSPILHHVCMEAAVMLDNVQPSVILTVQASTMHIMGEQ